MRTPERLAVKLAYLEEQIHDLQGLLAESDPLAGDPWRRRGLRYAVHTAIEAVIDVCYHLSAKRLHRAPSTPHEALDALVEAGLLGAERAAAWHGMFRLRNVLVHGYDVVSDVQLMDEVRSGLGDLEAFAAAVAPLVREARN